MPRHRLPDFLVIGAQKAGTTSLHRMLRQHPQVHMPRTKELHYFDFHYERGPQWYAAQFSPGWRERRSGEATPNYLYGPLATSRLIADLPGARIVAILRNPVDRAYSHWWHDRRRRELDRHQRDVGDTFETALVRERPEVFGRLAGDPASGADAADGAAGVDAAVPRRGNYVRRGEYAELLEPYLEAYPRSRVHLMLLDDLVADREASLRGLFGFLGVSRRPARRIQDSHANRFRQRADDGRMQATSYPPMSPSTRAALVEHFGPHNERLGALLGRDLGHWV